jgi:formylglycine-generating enzyme required for sulfatase activity
MDDPSKCHDHSKVPEGENEWPSLEAIIAYRDRVRARLEKVYIEEVGPNPSKRLGRVLSMVHEHQALHLETLLYMLLQISDKVDSPPGFSPPDWDRLRGVWDRQVEADGPKARGAKVRYPRSTLTMGHDDLDYEDYDTVFDPLHVFGWDNESPERKVEVGSFEIDVLPISNTQYLDYLSNVAEAEADSKETRIPSSWVRRDGGNWEVRTFFEPGFVGFDVAKHWPVMASGKQLAGYAKWKGGRLPTEEELRVFMADNPVDAPGRNVGFKNWHPVP